MDFIPLLMGAALGGGLLLVVIGFRTLTNKELDEDHRKRGFWPLNAGLVLACVSMYLFATGV
ncbi:MAG: hypothetical protein ACI9JL_001759 [Paracoccaceae bacterium]|jgi:hypothetical protein